MVICLEQGANLHMAQLIFKKSMDSCHCKITIRFASYQQSKYNTGTTFDNDFCTTAATAKRTEFCAKLWVESRSKYLRILANFHDVGNTLGCSPVSNHLVHFINFW